MTLHWLSSESCQCTKSLRDSGAVRLVLSIISAGEIVGQVIAVLNDRAVDLERQRVNLVFMGMGEPFLNYENFMAAVRLLVERARERPTRLRPDGPAAVVGGRRAAACRSHRRT